MTWLLFYKNLILEGGWWWQDGLWNWRLIKVVLVYSHSIPGKKGPLDVDLPMSSLAPTGVNPLKDMCGGFPYGVCLLL